MAKAAINKKKAFFHQQIKLKFKEENSKVVQMENGFVWCWNLDNLESRSEISGMFWNVVLEKGGYQLDKLWESCWSIT